MAERQILEQEPGMGLEAGEQAARQKQKNIGHNEANFGRRNGKINGREGSWSFRYPQRSTSENRWAQGQSRFMLA